MPSIADSKMSTKSTESVDEVSFMHSLDGIKQHIKRLLTLPYECTVFCVDERLALNSDNIYTLADNDYFCVYSGFAAGEEEQQQLHFDIGGLGGSKQAYSEQIVAGVGRQQNPKAKVQVLLPLQPLPPPPPRDLVTEQRQKDAKKKKYISDGYVLMDDVETRLRYFVTANKKRKDLTRSELRVLKTKIRAVLALDLQVFDNPENGNNTRIMLLHNSILDFMNTD